MRLETERLVLRKPELGDLDGIRGALGRPRSDAVPRRADAAAGRGAAGASSACSGSGSGTASGSSACSGRRTSGSSGGSATALGHRTWENAMHGRARRRSRAGDRLDRLEPVLGQGLCDRGGDCVSRPRVLRARPRAGHLADRAENVASIRVAEKIGERTSATSSSVVGTVGLYSLGKARRGRAGPRAAGRGRPRATPRSRSARRGRRPSRRRRPRACRPDPRSRRCRSPWARTGSRRGRRSTSRGRRAGLSAA